MLMNLNIETHGTIAFVSTVLSSIELKMVSNYYFFYARTHVNALNFEF